jgi:hypothetical protein
VIVTGPTVEQRLARVEGALAAVGRLEAEVRELRAALGSAAPTGPPKDCCSLGQWQDRQNLPRACAHWDPAAERRRQDAERQREIEDAEDDAEAAATLGAEIE